MMLVNGEPRTGVPVSDRGLAYGDGLFETLAVRHGEPLHWGRHMARMAEGCRRLGLPMPETTLWLAEARRVLAAGSYPVLKLMLTRGEGPRGYRPPSSPRPTRIVAGQQVAASPDPDGMDVRICRTRLGCNPLLAGIKHLNRLEQVLARGEWQDEFHEGIMLDIEDHVVEGTMSNLFLVRHGALHTPMLDRCGVAGITRARVMEAARALNVAVHEGRYRLADLHGAQGLFLTNTLIGLCPVVNLDGRGLPCDLPLLIRLRAFLEESGA